MANILVQKLTKSFGDNLALSEIDLAIPNGSFVVLLGPTGAYITPINIGFGVRLGRVFIDDTDCSGQTPAERNVAMVFQQYSLYPHMSVKENLEISNALYGRVRNQ